MADSDYLVDAAKKFSPKITAFYRLFADKKPIMLLDIQEERVYAYPYSDFSKALRRKSQRSLKEQYEQAVKENQMVVFVRDNEKKRLISFSVDVE